MLAKLFKHEFKDTSKTILGSYIFLAVVTALGAILMSFDSIRNGDNQTTGIILVSYMLFYVFTVMGFFIVDIGYLCIRFYKTMYASQGYLTHTLPVKTLTIFNVKLAVSTVWTLISSFLMMISVLLFFGASGAEISLADFFNALSTYGIPLSAYIYTILTAILSCLLVYAFFNACIAIGQLFNQHRILISAAVGLVFYILMQIFGLSLISVTVIGGPDSAQISAASAANSLMWSSLGVLVIFFLIFYGISAVILHKKLNLE